MLDEPFVLIMPIQRRPLTETELNSTISSKQYHLNRIGNATTIMNAFVVCLSLIPLAVYFLLLGVIHASRRPFLVSGSMDMAALCAAAFGMVFAGPMNLFFPVNAAIRFGTYVWLILGILYFLIAMLIILYSRPRLIVYNIDKTTLEEILEKIANRLDDQSCWAGDSLFMPQEGITLHLECVSGLKNVTIVSNEKNASRLRWRNLKLLLSSELKKTVVSRNYRSIILFLLSAALFLVSAVSYFS